MINNTFGSFLGKVITAAFVPGYILFVADSLFSFSIILMGLLPTSPRIATISAMMLVAVFGAQRGIETVARVASFVFPGTVLVLLGACFYVASRGSWTGLTYYPADVWRTVNGSVHLLPLFFGLNMYLVVNQHYLHKNRRSIKLIMIAMLVSVVTLILVYVATALAISYAGIKEVARPVQFVMQLAEIKGFIVQRFGLVFIVLVTFFETVFCSAHLWGVSKTIAEVFNLRPIREKWIVFGLGVVIVVVFWLIKNQETSDWLLESVLFPLSWLYLIIEPTVKLILSYILGRPKPSAVPQPQSRPD